MGKKRRLIITLSAILVAGIIGQSLRPSEPTYQSKRLSQYLDQMAPTSSNVFYRPGDKANQNSVKAIYLMGPKAIPYLQQALRKKDSLSVKVTLFLRAKLPFFLARHLPTLDVHHLTAIAAASAECLSYFGSSARPALPDLINCFTETHDNGGLLGAASMAVREIGPRPENLPALLALLNSTNVSAPYLAADCIGQIGVTNTAVLESLTKLIQGKDTNLRRCAVRTLGDLHDKAAPTIPLLTPFLNDPNSELRLDAAEALLKIQGPHAIPVKWIVNELDQELHHGLPPSPYPEGMGSHEWNLFKLCEILRPLKTEAEPAVPLLRSVRDDKNVNRMLKMHATKALWEINHETNNLVPICVEGLKHMEVKLQAAFLLTDFCVDQRLALPELNQLLDAPELAIQFLGIRTLSKLNVQSDKILPVMTRSLEDHFTTGPWSKDLRHLAAEALGELGPKAKPAVPALTCALKDPDEKVRTAAAKALKQIDPEAAVKAGIK